jgi:hypothetical protein
MVSFNILPRKSMARKQFPFVKLNRLLCSSLYNVDSLPIRVCLRVIILKKNIIEQHNEESLEYIIQVTYVHNPLLQLHQYLLFDNEH